MEEIVFDPEYFQPILDGVIKNYKESFAQEYFEQNLYEKLKPFEILKEYVKEINKNMKSFINYGV